MNKIDIFDSTKKKAPFSLEAFDNFDVIRRVEEYHHCSLTYLMNDHLKMMYHVLHRMYFGNKVEYVILEHEGSDNIIKIFDTRTEVAKFIREEGIKNGTLVDLDKVTDFKNSKVGIFFIRYGLYVYSIISIVDNTTQNIMRTVILELDVDYINREIKHVKQLRFNEPPMSSWYIAATNHVRHSTNMFGVYVLCKPNGNTSVDHNATARITFNTAKSKNMNIVVEKSLWNKDMNIMKIIDEVIFKNCDI